MNLLYEASRLVARSLCVLALAWAATAVPALAQSGSISGKVTDAADGSPLAGANVLVIGPGGAMVTGAAATDDGSYQIDSVPAGSYTLRGRFLGYQEYEQAVSISGGQRLVVNIVLSQTGFELNTVVITGSRRQEKVLDAPSSISVLTARDIETSVGTSSVEALRNTTGVDMAQTGVDRREVVLRGFNNAFSGAAYVMTDYRHSVVPSLNVNIFSIMPNMNIDVDRVEVVRGPGSALYGPGVDSGVIHFITKDPFTHPGTTIQVSGGEQSLLGVQFRHAGVLGPSRKLGYKVTGMYGTADDWPMDPADPALARDLTPRRTEYEKLNVNGSLEYRLTEKASLIANGGYSTLTAAVLSGIGNLQADGFGYTYGQVRFVYDRFFAQAYLNKNETGDSFVYGQDFGGDGIPDPVVDKSTLLNLQSQYDFDLGSRTNVIVGADAEFTRPKTEGTIIGRNEGETITEAGAYAQTLVRVDPKLDLTLALRGDYNNVADDFQVSPRAAVVFKPTNSHSFRVSYNRAFSSPSTNSMFLDIIAGQIPGTNIMIRGRGTGQGFSWERNPAFEALAGSDLVASSLNPATLGAKTPLGLPLDAVYASMYAGVNAIPNATLQAMLAQAGINVPAPLIPQLKALLAPGTNPGQTNVQGFSRGILGKLNLTTLGVDIVSGLDDLQPLEATTTQSVEVGYKGILGPRLIVAVDAYYTKKKNFVGPLLMETPFVIVPNLRTDLGVAIAAGIQGNAALAGALGQLGLTPAQVSGLLVQLAGSALPSSSTPVAIVQPVENNPGVGQTPELMLSYRNFGDLSYYGVDASFEFQASEEFGIFGNLSMVNKDLFDNEDLGGGMGDALELALNASKLKGRLGVRYDGASGLSVNVAARQTEGFPVISGPYVGDVESYFVVDLGVGYDLKALAQGLRLDLGISNALDNMHREFVGAPEMGRMGILRATFTF